MIRPLLALALAVTASLAEAQMTELENDLKDAFASGQLADLHGVLVRQNGTTLAEVYFDGEDESWGQPLGSVRHGPDTLHDLRSVSKTITGLLYGIALDRGQVPPPDTPVLSLFPDLSDLSTPERDRITIADVLTMRMGTDWNENLPYSDPRNSEIAMELAPDRYRFVLDRPMVSAPGTTWIYNGGATALLARIVELGTGKPIDAYASDVLFTPLGITRYEWAAGSDGTPSAASGLRMTARDLARIGEMIAARGVSDGQRIVSTDWLDRMIRPRARPDPLRYGYHWWLSPEGDPPNWLAGFGNGGQRLSISPRLGLVIVIFAGRYNDFQAWELPVAVINDHVAPALGLR